LPAGRRARLLLRQANANGSDFREERQ